MYKSTKTYRIDNTISGLCLGEYAAETESAALDAMARDAGYSDYAEAQSVAPAAYGEIVVTEIANTKTYRIVFHDNSGSSAVDVIAASVNGSWSNSVSRFDGEHDLAFIEVPSENAEYLETLLNGDDNVVSYAEQI